ASSSSTSSARSGAWNGPTPSPASARSASCSISPIASIASACSPPPRASRPTWTSSPARCACSSRCCTRKTCCASSATCATRATPTTRCTAARSRASRSRRPAPRSRRACAANARSISSPSSIGRPSDDAPPRSLDFSGVPRCGLRRRSRPPVLHARATRGARRAAQGARSRPAKCRHHRFPHHAPGRLRQAPGRPLDGVRQRRCGARGHRGRAAGRSRAPRRPRAGDLRGRRPARRAATGRNARPRHRSGARRARRRRPGARWQVNTRARQDGAALMVMLAILILGAAWWAVTALSTPVDRTASERVHNARILQEAKSALIGYVAHTAAMTGEDDPGRLPCPEAFGAIGGVNEGKANGNCTLPAVGRLPWRTLGLDKWRDASGEPLWYVVSPAWALSNSTVPPLTTYINSNSTGQLTLDGTADVVALIIAPGRPLQISASAGCTARVQRRTTPSPTIDLRDYLDCENATLPADAAFVSTGPADSFNDQVLSITGAEILPGIEA